MTIADDFFQLTGKTVGQKAAEFYREGWPIEHAAHYMGYACSTDLRRYLSTRGIPCPWPLTQRQASTSLKRAVTDAEIERYALLRLRGSSAVDAARQVRHHVRTMREMLKVRRPELVEAIDNPGDALVSLAWLLNWTDSKGKRHQMQRTLQQTIHPLNTGLDGLPKTREQIVNELIAELTAWMVKNER